MECAQINITGGKGTQKPTTYSIPGIYKSSDPGLLINIYPMKGEYAIPGELIYSDPDGLLSTLMLIITQVPVYLPILNLLFTIS